MTTIPSLPDLGPEYERTIDEMIDVLVSCKRSGWYALSIEQDIGRRRTARDAILDLQDELNDAGLVIVPEADWNAGQAAVARLAAYDDAFERFRS